MTLPRPSSTTPHPKPEPKPEPGAAAITRKSRSNLALSFFMLPPAIRRDISVFYAFCRVIDDLVDSTERTDAQKQEGLDEWRRILAEMPEEPDLISVPGAGPDLAAELSRVIRTYQIPRDLFEELIAGVEMDIRMHRYPDWPALRQYCYRVASVVGLISIEIFGYRNPLTREYAVNLGYALQLTNILRDVEKDRRLDGRIYLPQEEMSRYSVSEQSLLEGRPDGHFQELMRFEAQRAWDFYRVAGENLPPEDRGRMRAAEMMRRTYRRLLINMERDGFRVFDRRYRLGKMTKLGLALGSLVRQVLGR